MADDFTASLHLKEPALAKRSGLFHYVSRGV